jgi:DNA-binding beta-propeller fold protein YncE
MWSRVGVALAAVGVAACLTASAWGAQLRQIGILDIPGPPGFGEAVFANGMLVLSHEAGNTLDIFDPARRRIVAQVEGMSGPHGLAVDARASRVYVANADSRSIAVVSSTQWKVERVIPLETVPYGLALGSGGEHLFVANWRDRSITSVDLGNGELMTVDVQGSPQSLAFDPARQLLYASLQDTAEIITLDAATLKVMKRYKLQASQPTAIALNPATRRLYVAVRHAVLTLDAETGNELGRAPAPAGVDSLWINASAGMLYVASGGGFVDVFRTNSALTQVEEIHTEVRGHTLAYDPARGFIYLPGGREGRSKLLILKQLPPIASPEEKTQQQVATR